MKSASQKMQEDVKKHVIYWQTEFEVDKWAVAGVLIDIAMDMLMVVDADEEEEDDEEDE